MIIPRLGVWSSASGRFFIWERLYYSQGQPSILCRVTLRYLKTACERSIERDLRGEPITES